MTKEQMCSKIDILFPSRRYKQQTEEKNREDFDSAKEECLFRLWREIEMIKDVTFEEFRRYKG
jgi:hypothetical protein